MNPRIRLLCICAPLLLSLACVSSPRNVPIDSIDLSSGYRPSDPSRYSDPGRVWLFLAFSGGGTRAAALAYGVLEQLRDTTYIEDGQERRLLDEIDAISGVSGGSFPAAYYGLFGDRIFEEFEERFLKKNIQRGILLRALRPWNLIRLMTPYLSRSDLASRYYHDNVFDQATFKDLAAAKGPRIHINATDLPTGTTMRFNQGLFDVLCSDLDPFPVATAVAASSAVPVLLSPITLRNYAGRCGFEPPDWLDVAIASRSTNPRGYRAAVSVSDLFDSERKRYIHLIDGGVSDNLGVRVPLDRIAAMGGIRPARADGGFTGVDHMVVIVVNAETSPDPLVDLKAAAPSLAASMNMVSGSQIRRYNFESLLLLKSSMDSFKAELSTEEAPFDTHLVEVSFDLIDDPEERQYFKRTVTSFFLTDERVDRLRAVGRQLLADSPELNRLLEKLRGQE